MPMLSNDQSPNPNQHPSACAGKIFMPYVQVCDPLNYVNPIAHSYLAKQREEAANSGCESPTWFWLSVAAVIGLAALTGKSNRPVLESIGEGIG